MKCGRRCSVQAELLGYRLSRTFKCLICCLWKLHTLTWTYSWRQVLVDSKDFEDALADYNEALRLTPGVLVEI